MHACMHIHTYIHTYTHLHVYIHTCIHTYACIHTYIIHTYHVYIHTYIHTYIRTYIHTYRICVCSLSAIGTAHLGVEKSDACAWRMYLSRVFETSAHYPDRLARYDESRALPRWVFTYPSPEPNLPHHYNICSAHTETIVYTLNVTLYFVKIAPFVIECTKN